MVGNSKELVKDWRIRVLIVAIILLGIVPLAFKGLQFGMDFSGGSVIQLELEEEVDANTMGTIVQILTNRLNGFGLRDVSVKPWENKYVIVEVSEKEEQGLNALKDILSKQGRFEAVIDGEIALYSRDLTQIITNPQEGYGYIGSTGQWSVPFTLSSEGANRFARVAEGKCVKEGGESKCQRIYMYIDRPQDSVIVVPSGIYDGESIMNIDPSNPKSFPIELEELERNSLTKIIMADEITEELVASIAASNHTSVIIPENSSYNTSLFLESGIAVHERPKTGAYWLWDALNLKSVLFLTPGVTSGEPISQAVITGHAPDFATAQSEMTQMVVILKSGRLPVSLSIMSTMSVSPTLGEGFKQNTLYIGLAALLAVAAVVFIRYRSPILTLLIMANNMIEVVIVLGIASIISWQIDLAAMGGLIAALGTGVDHLIIIIDEAMRGGKGEEESSLVNRIHKAFTIVIIAGTITIAAMFPLMTMGLGMLKGFAITTILGVLVGLLITRPAFAKIVEKVV